VVPNQAFLSQEAELPSRHSCSLLSHISASSHSTLKLTGLSLHSTASSANDPFTPAHRRNLYPSGFIKLAIFPLVPKSLESDDDDLPGTPTLHSAGGWKSSWEVEYEELMKEDEREKEKRVWLG
jgi:hypothetical protein